VIKEDPVKKLLPLAFVVVLAALLLPSEAQASTPSLAKLAKTVAALQSKVATQATQISRLSTKLTNDEGTINSQGATIGALSTDLASAQTAISGLQGNVSSLTTTVSGLQGNVGSLTTTVAGQTATLTNDADVLALEPWVRVSSPAPNTVTGPTIVFQGCNLQIKSPTSEIDDSGLGNLIVGWDDPPPGLAEGLRSGANNLVCGDENSFSGNGGFVAGYDNTVSRFWASVSGGSGNEAVNDCSSVSGGSGNGASGEDASVFGGDENTASGMFATVCGGEGNTALAGHTTVTGANSVTESTGYGWSAGGDFHSP
jgi:uncharacterized coiled-coil protein SlyX